MAVLALFFMDRRCRCLCCLSAWRAVVLSLLVGRESPLFLVWLFYSPFFQTRNFHLNTAPKSLKKNETNTCKETCYRGNWLQLDLPDWRYRCGGELSFLVTIVFSFTRPITSKHASHPYNVVISESCQGGFCCFCCGCLPFLFDEVIYVFLCVQVCKLFPLSLSLSFLFSPTPFSFSFLLCYCSHVIVLQLFHLFLPFVFFFVYVSVGSAQWKRTRLTWRRRRLRSRA